MKFTMTQSICPEGIDLLKKEFPGVDIDIANGPNPNTYLSTMKDTDALIVRIASCDSNVIEHSPNLKVIGRTGVGYDSVDVSAATKRGIPVVIAPGANARSVAEHAIGLLFSLAKNLEEQASEFRNGNWEVRGNGKPFELLHKKIAILGFGAIGHQTASIASALGMEVLVYGHHEDQIRAAGYTAYDSITDILKVADIVSVHLPLTNATRDLIGAEELALMKSNALVINTGRGGIINEHALTDALKNGIVAGAALDVFEEEPPANDSPLLSCPNLLVTPHVAAQTKEAVIRMATMCVEGCAAVLRGEKWPYVADPAVYEHPTWKNKQ